MAGLFFNLPKAFDIIHHILLLEILQRYGICGNCANLIGSYLKNREQPVCIKAKGNSYFSTSTLIEQGVLQGSMLRSVLFLLYVNGLCDGFMGRFGLSVCV